MLIGNIIFIPVIIFFFALFYFLLFYFNFLANNIKHNYRIMYLLVRIQARFRGLISRKKVKTIPQRKQLMEFKKNNSRAVRLKKIVN